MNSLTTMPFEIVEMIFSRLTVKGKLAARGVCTMYKDMLPIRPIMRERYGSDLEMIEELFKNEHYMKLIGIDREYDIIIPNLELVVQRAIEDNGSIVLYYITTLDSTKLRESVSKIDWFDKFIEAIQEDLSKTFSFLCKVCLHTLSSWELEQIFEECVNNYMPGYCKMIIESCVSMTKTFPEYKGLLIMCAFNTGLLIWAYEKLEITLEHISLNDYELLRNVVLEGETNPYKWMLDRYDIPVEVITGGEVSMLREMIVEENLKMVKHTIEKYNLKSEDIDEEIMTECVRLDRYRIIKFLERKFNITEEHNA